MLCEQRARGPRAGHDLQDARWEAGGGEEGRDGEGAEGVFFAGFDDDDVAGAERGRALQEHGRDGRVEGVDGGADAEGLVAHEFRET